MRLALIADFIIKPKSVLEDPKLHDMAHAFACAKTLALKKTGAEPGAVNREAIR